MLRWEAILKIAWGVFDGQVAARLTVCYKSNTDANGHSVPDYLVRCFLERQVPCALIVDRHTGGAINGDDG